MKILLYNNNHLPSIGGKEIVVHHLARCYVAKGHEVVLAGPGGFWIDRGFTFDYPIHRWPRIPGLRHPRDWRVHFVIERLRFRFDVIHAHTTYPNGYVAALMKGWHRRPLVITPHGADIHKVPEIGFGHRLDPELDEKIRYALERAESVTAISKAVEDSILDTGVDAAKICAIPNGVDVERFARIQTFDIHAYLDIPPEAPLIVSIGNYHPRKGHEVLVDALRLARERIPDMRLAIVGRKSDILEEKITRDGMTDYVRYTGLLEFPLPGQEDEPDVLSALLQSTTAYVSSSMAQGTEGLSLALLEAMSAGVCPIATRVSGNVDIIDNRVNGLLVEPGNATSLADAMVEMCTNAHDRERFAGMARQTVEPFTWQAIAERYLDLFESLCK
ncbi:MAG: glycosyltransferase family 4 protein [Pseudomonadales bacterium]|jgi:glycosyltransferase involved in cell wall biosynthesis|nr:glycosyltransferase family 4 protein [Pseudomonadales bacterium]MDP6473002.1 glycosyltransferase family 4 protein [Pseudomonadales bacterium]MDP6826241.1 glycosyltransferase family 4 protein [Pseudomonadales bacterium]MDP6971927.1 glycosyltransferase family 4 protein [Pseudomonadales bacterium]|tara:strand:- start:693 stop:1856 length:1164 start_codon:yes stop_codon:yes gene_type:complete